MWYIVAMKKAVVLSVGCPKCGALPHKQCKDSDRCCPAHQERWENLWGSRQRAVIISRSSYKELIAALKPDDRYLGDNGELVLISRRGNCLHVFASAQSDSTSPLTEVSREHEYYRKSIEIILRKGRQQGSSMAIPSSWGAPRRSVRPR